MYALHNHIGAELFKNMLREYNGKVEEQGSDSKSKPMKNN